jgi:hypothetical protein
MRVFHPIFLPFLLSWFTVTGQTGFITGSGHRYGQFGVGAAIAGTQWRSVVTMADPALGPRIAIWDHAANGTWTSQNVLALPGRAFAQASAPGMSGALFICGSLVGPDSATHDALLVKVDAANNVLFVHIGSASTDQQLLDVVALPDGGAVACGIDNSAGQHDALVLRVDATGVLLWSVTIPGILDEEANALAVSGSDVMITGRQMNFGGTSDCYFALLDLNGNVAWTTSWGGADDEVGEAIVSTSPGKFVMAGTSHGFGTFDETDNGIKPHVYLIKIDLLGDTMWTTAIGDTLFRREALAIGLALNGDLLIAGQREPEHGIITDAMVLRTDGTGHVLWEKPYGAGREDRLVDILPLVDGFIACGSSFGPDGQQVLLVRKDANGD